MKGKKIIFLILFFMVFIFHFYSPACGEYELLSFYNKYSGKYYGDWSKLPNAKTILKRNIIKRHFDEGYGDKLRKEFFKKHEVRLKDLAYRISWKKKYNKYKNAMFHIRSCKSVIIENVAIIQLDPDYRSSSSLLIEDCEEVIIKNSYFSGTVNNYHVRIEGCERIFIDNVEIAGFDYNKKGIRCGGGILINNGDPKQGGTNGVLSPNPYNLKWSVIQNSYIHDNLNSDKKRNQDGINLLSAADGLIFNCFFENWQAGDSALDISHRREDPAYKNKFYRIERNLFYNCKRVKTPGKSQNGNILFFANNFYQNAILVDYHKGWDLYHVNETFIFDENKWAPHFYSLLGVSNGFSYLENCLISVKGRPLQSVFFLHKVDRANEFKSIRPDHCLFLMPDPVFWLGGSNLKIHKWKNWQNIRNQDMNSKLIFDDGYYGPSDETKCGLTLNSPALGFGSKKFLEPDDLRMMVEKDFWGKSRKPNPSAGAFEVHDCNQVYQN